MMRAVLIGAGVGFAVAVAIVCIAIAQPNGPHDWEAWRVALAVFPASIIVGALIAAFFETMP